MSVKSKRLLGLGLILSPILGFLLVIYSTGMDVTHGGIGATILCLGGVLLACSAGTVPAGLVLIFQGRSKREGSRILSNRR